MSEETRAVTELDVLRNLRAHLENIAPELHKRAVQQEIIPKLFRGDVWECYERVLARIDRGQDALGAVDGEIRIVGSLVHAPTSDAVFSPCRNYRYTLTRRWNDGGTTLAVIGLNPSTADERIDDPTIRRCIDFAKRWGHSRLVMLNLFAWRSTDPKGMIGAGDPVGPDNDSYLLTETKGCTVLCAWGTNGYHQNRDEIVKSRLTLANRQLWCLGTTKHGFPKHPLYLAANTNLTEFR